MHHAVHDKCRTSHVSAILEQRDEEEQNHNLGQEDQHASHAADDSVNQQVAQDAIGHDLANPVSQPADAVLDPLLGIGSQRECGLKHQPHQYQQDGQCQPAVGQQAVHRVAGLGLIGGSVRVGGEGFGQRTTHKSILQVGDDAHDVAVVVALDVMPHVGRGTLHRLGIVLAVEQFDGMLVVLDDLEYRVTVKAGTHSGQFFQAILDEGAIVHIVVGGLLFALFDGVHHGLEHILDATSVIGRERHHASAQQPAHHLDVQFVTALLQFVPHVQRHHHGDVHVHELGGQVQVALQVAGIDDVEDGVGMIVADVGADIHFLW